MKLVDKILNNLDENSLFALWYKEDNSKKWKKSSLTMKSKEAIAKQGELLKKQENWKEIKVTVDGEDANESISESDKPAGYIAIFQGKKIEIPISIGSLYMAKQEAIKQLKVPKSKEGLLSIKAAYNENSEQLSTEEMYDKLMSNWKRNPPGRRFGHAGEYYKELKKVKIKNISDREESMIKELWSMYGSSLS